MENIVQAKISNTAASVAHHRQTVRGQIMFPLRTTVTPVAAPVLKNVICNTLHNNMRHVTDLYYRIQKHTVVFTYIHMAVIKDSIKPVVESPF